jgi:hypothetical protein
MTTRTTQSEQVSGTGSRVRRLRVWPEGAPAQAALLLFVYAIIQVAINGIVLDETVIAAQIITGAVSYEAIYYPGAFSLPHYLSALLWIVRPSTAFISASRNVLFLFLPTFATFLLVFVLTRRALWGYLAVALVVAEANLRFAGLYPMSSFPAVYSNGHVGLHAVILVTALLIGGMWRSSGLLLGLLPAIHATFALMVWPWALLVLLGRRIWSDRAAIRDLLVWGSIGVLVCLLLLLLIRFTADVRAPVPPYDVVANGDLIRQQFTLWTDSHRRPVPLAALAYFANPIVFFVLGALVWSFAKRAASQSAASDGTGPAATAVHSDGSWTGPEPSQILSIIGLGVVVWIYIWGTRLWQSLGTLPDFVAMTMPSRFSNITAALLPPLVAVAFACVTSALRKRQRAVVFGLLGALLLIGAFAAANPTAADTRSLVSRNLLFALLGIVLACGLLASAGRQRVGMAVGLVAVAAALFSYWRASHIAGYYLAAGAVTGIGVALARGTRLPGGLIESLQRIGGARLLAPGLVLLSLAALPGRTADRIFEGYTRRDMQTPETRALDEWLNRNAQPDEPVLTTFTPNPELQLKTAQPVLFEHKTLWIMAYMPQLAGVIGTMARDLYGVDYEDLAFLSTACDGGYVSQWCPIWRTAWERRSSAEWRQLGAKYRFRLVLAASTVHLNLNTVVEGERWTLYAIE